MCDIKTVHIAKLGSDPELNLLRRCCGKSGKHRYPFVTQWIVTSKYLMIDTKPYGVMVNHFAIQPYRKFTIQPRLKYFGE